MRRLILSLSVLLLSAPALSATEAKPAEVAAPEARISVVEKAAPEAVALKITQVKAEHRAASDAAPAQVPIAPHGCVEATRREVGGRTVLLLRDITASLRREDGLRRLLAGCTAVVIAHRLSTIRQAGRIVVLDGGRIVEQGTHDELISRNETYQLVHEQRAARREFLLEPEVEAAEHARDTTGGLA
ncbi:MAG: hypothetical protein KY464_15970 [Gemmatimonadetes bacterium]|nr:hypothetical protein [Gemmatimonadota bacterium]